MSENQMAFPKIWDVLVQISTPNMAGSLFHHIVIINKVRMLMLAIVFLANVSWRVENAAFAEDCLKQWIDTHSVHSEQKKGV